MNKFMKRFLDLIGPDPKKVLDKFRSEEDKRQQRAIAQHLSKPRPYSMPCACMGKLNEDDPACKCAMAWHEKVDGHWYKISERGGDVIAERAH